MALLNLIKRLPIDLGQGHYRHTTKAKLMAYNLVEQTNNRTALDFGCGDGFWTKKLEAKGWEVTSTDNFDFRFSKTKEINAEKPLPFADNTFDLIWSSEVIEHVKNVEQLIAEFRRITKPGGRLIITTPNSAFWLYKMTALLGFSPADIQNPDHKQFFAFSDIRKLFPTADILGFFPYAVLKYPIRRFVGPLSPTFIISEDITGN